MNRSLEIPNLEVIKEEDEGPFRVVHVRSIDPVAKVCNLGCRTTFNGWKTRDINDVPHYGRPTILRFHGRRFACTDCDRGEGKEKGNSGIYERTSFTPKGFWITNRCLDWIAQECVRRQFSEVARAIGVDPQTASKAFKVRSDEVAAQRKVVIPRVLGIDEIWVDKQYRAVAGDVENLRTLDMLFDRDAALKMWLNELSDHRQVEVIVTDRHDPYRSMIRERMRGRLHVTDRWHVVKYANDALDVIRSSIAKHHPNRRLGAALRMAKRLFHLRWHDAKHDDQMALLGWFSAIPILREAYWAKERYFEIWVCDIQGC